SAYRGYSARKFFKKHKAICELLISLGIDQGTASEASIIIQAAYRGHLTRKYVKTHTVPSDVQMSPEDRMSFNKYMIFMNVSWIDINAAASNIQIAFRNKLRKSKTQLQEVKKERTASLTHSEITHLAEEMVTSIISSVLERKESVEVLESIKTQLVSKAEEVISETVVPEEVSENVVKYILSSLVLKIIEEETSKTEKAEEIKVEVLHGVKEETVPHEEVKEEIKEEFVPQEEVLSYEKTKEEVESQYDALTLEEVGKKETEEEEFNPSTQEIRSENPSEVPQTLRDRQVNREFGDY
ncbi:hypothetical protein L9F63_004795, partial [Diploptera punctata]